MQFDRSDVGHGIQVEAPGYQTFRTSKPYHLGDPDPKLDIRLQPGPRFVGRVLDGEGHPVRGAKIGVASPLEQLDPAGLADVETDSAIGYRVVSDDDGRFEIPAYRDRYALVVVSPNGFAEVERDASQIPGEIPLKRWAKVTGRLVQSGKPVPNREIFLVPIRVRGEASPRNLVRWTATTSDDGSFAFERVPPVPCFVEAWLHFGAQSPLKSSRSMPLSLAPGEKAEITLGGPGSDVTGQLVAENQPAGFDYHFAINYLVAKRPGIQPPAGLTGKGFDWQKGWSDAWFNAPEGKAYLGTLHTWFVKPEPAGRFLISGVEPGEYDFAVNLYGSTEGCLVHPIAQRVVHFSVKPGETKLDLGKLSIPSFTLPKVGDVAGDFSFETPAGTKTSLAALRGNYVLIDFWATWCAPCVEKLEQVEHLREQFKADKPLLVVGANLDAETDRARQFLKNKPLPWQHALLGDWSATDVPRRFAVSTVPAYVLIGPDGRILALEYSLEGVAAKLEQETKSAKVRNSSTRVEPPRNGQSTPVARTAVASVEPPKKPATKAQDSNAGGGKAATVAKRRKPREPPQFPTKGSMRVQIVDTAGKPLKKAKIFASIWTADEKFEPNREYATDSEGFATVQLPKTVQIVRLWGGGDGYCTEFKGFESDAAVDALVIPDNFQFRLVRGTLIGGVVKDQAGQPIKGVKVQYSCGDQSFVENETFTDAGGRWKCDDVRPGMDVTIKVTHPDYLSDDDGGELQKQQKITSAALRAQTASVVLRRGRRIAGKVTDPAGKPVKGAVLVSGTDIYMQNTVQPIAADANGQFQFPVMPTGPVRITLLAKGFMPETRQIQIAAGMPPADFQLKPGKKLRIRIVDRDGKPLPEAFVRLGEWRGVRDLYTNPNWKVKIPVPTRANSEGVYEWDGAPSDAVKLNISSKGYAYIRAASFTADGKEHSQVLDPILQISGTVRDAGTGKLLEKFSAVPVIHFSPNFAVLGRGDTRAGHAGVFELEFNRTDCEHGVQIEAAGYRTFRTPKRWRSGEADANLDVRLEPSPRYLGSVVGPDGRPDKDARVYQATATEKFSLWTYQLSRFKAGPPESPDFDEYRRIPTDRNGGFEIAAPPEKYTIVAMSRDGYGEATRAASELPGQVRLARWAKVTGRLVQSGKVVPNDRVFLTRNSKKRRR